METQETSQPNGGTSSGSITILPDMTFLPDMTMTATHIIAMRDRRMDEIQTERGQHMARVAELDAEAKQLGGIGSGPKASNGPARSATSAPVAVDPLTDGKRGRGRPPGARNKKK